jgi:hypothetical protein
VGVYVVVVRVRASIETLQFTLLCELQRVGVGCCIGNIFVGGLAHAGDVALLTPTPDAIRRMLNICDKLAAEFKIVFNDKKSTKASWHSCSIVACLLYWCNATEIVDKWPHLGYIISCERNYEADISNRCNSLLSQINNVLCYFKYLSSPVELKLLQAYCSSLFGSDI